MREENLIDLCQTKILFDVILGIFVENPNSYVFKFHFPTCSSNRYVDHHSGYVPKIYGC